MLPGSFMEYTSIHQPEGYRVCFPESGEARQADSLQGSLLQGRPRLFTPEWAAQRVVCVVFCQAHTWLCLLV